MLALTNERELRCWSHVDERSAAFFAVGLAKTTRRAVVVTCTSGTAAANFAPAVHEAHEARVPLIVLTADRPAELRDTGAGQTIDQVKMFGGAAKWFVEMDVAEASAERERWVRRLACRAVWTAEGGRPGPVHLNVPLREPLVPPTSLPPGPVGPRAGGRPFLARTRDEPSGAPLELGGPGWVVAGGGADPGVVAWAEAAGWPLLADPLSGVRSGGAAVAHFDALAEVLPDPACVVRAGDLPTSKRLRRRLAALTCPQVSLDPELAWPDPDGAVSHVHPGPVERLRAPAAEPGWLARWRDADAAAARAADEVLGDGVSEPNVARHLGRVLDAGELLWVASSMPVRDVEALWPVRDDGPRVLSNRGANGIDGLPSSAFGAAAAGAGAVTLLVGDVAVLHDLGGLLAHRRLGLDLRLVVLNNDGGGIFSFLPVAEAAPPGVFEAHVATPHGTDFARVAALFDLPYTRAENLDDVTRPGLVEVRTDRAENLALHRRLHAAMEGAARNSA